MEEAGTIRELLLRELLQAREDVSATIAGCDCGFTFRIRYGGLERTLATSRGSLRQFATLDTAGAFARNIGIERFSVDMTGYTPGRLRGPRPDRSEALRRSRTRMRQEVLEF